MKEYSCIYLLIYLSIFLSLNMSLYIYMYGHICFMWILMHPCVMWRFLYAVRSIIVQCVCMCMVCKQNTLLVYTYLGIPDNNKHVFACTR